MNIDRAKDFAGGLGGTITNFLRWVIHCGRKHSIVAAGYLVLYAWFFFHNASARQPDFPPPLPPVPQTSASPDTSPIAAPLAPSPSPASVVPLAQAQAFRNGNNIVIRWNQSVSSPQLFADGALLTATCQPQTCTAPVSGKIYQLKAEWQESGQPVEKIFRF